MRKVLLLVPDLFFRVRIGDVVRALGATPVDVTAANVQAEVADAALLVVDAAPAVNGLAVVQLLKGDPATAWLPVLGFGSHVDVAGQRAALQAGCDRLVTRGKLMAELPTLLAGFLTPAPAAEDKV